MNVLAVGAHPLDIVFLCEGALARCARAGHSVAMAYLALLMSEPPHFSLERLTATREEEPARALSLIGASVQFLRFEALLLFRTAENKLRVIELIRKVKPHVILPHDPEDYHPEHQVTTALVHESSLLARQYVVETESPPTKTYSEIICMDTVAGVNFRPERFVSAMSSRASAA